MRRSSETLFLLRLKVSKKSESSPCWIGRDVARDVAAGRRVLDLDDLGAEVGELQRPQRARTELLDRDDPEVGEWRRHARAGAEGRGIGGSSADAARAARGGPLTRIVPPFPTGGLSNGSDRDGGRLDGSRGRR